MNRFKHRIRNDWQFLVVAVTTAAIGLNFLANPGLLDDHSTYAFIVSVLDDAVFSVPISITGIIGIITFSIGWVPARIPLLVFYQFVWTVLFLAYFWRTFNGYPNSSWIMALAINVMIFLVALWGEADG
ncbi:hypothetical protein [Enterococcus asini]|uniref:hypothetical protein n=1 Tax=Enterococcus asini TaxID=57732 RepID=UPI0022E5D7D6|nr:hypothetical protein [Enterococcus asini]